MYVSPITVANSRINNYSLAKNKSNKANNHNIVFRRNFEVKELDLVLENMKKYRTIVEKLRKEKEAVRMAADNELGKINKEIEPIIEDEEFLWQITPMEKRDKYAAFIIGSFEESPVSPNDQEKLASHVMSVIKKRFLSNEPEEMQSVKSEIQKVDLSDVPEELLDQMPAYKKLLKELKEHINRKLIQEDSYKKQVSEIDTKQFKETENINTFPSGFLGFEEWRTFYSRLVERAMTKKDSLTGKNEYPELQKIYNERKKYHYDRYWGKFNIAETPESNSQNAAVNDIIAYLKTGIADSLEMPF